MKASTLILSVMVIIMTTMTIAGPVTWTGCQIACYAAYVTCCGAFGVAAGPAAPVGIAIGTASCITAETMCMTACSAALVAPIP